MCVEPYTALLRQERLPKSKKIQGMCIHNFIYNQNT